MSWCRHQKVTPLCRGAWPKLSTRTGQQARSFARTNPRTNFNPFDTMSNLSFSSLNALRCMRSQCQNILVGASTSKLTFRNTINVIRKFPHATTREKWTRQSSIVPEEFRILQTQALNLLCLQMLKSKTDASHTKESLPLPIVNIENVALSWGHKKRGD